jgi:RNA polymerase sigma-70 factor (ECF subfamily)
VHEQQEDVMVRDQAALPILRPVSASEDAELVEAARAGHREAFGVLVARHRARTSAVVLSLLGSPLEAEDVTQEALVRAYADLQRLRDPARFGAWLRAIAVNLARMHLRTRRRARLVELIDDGEQLGSRRGIEEELDGLERAHAVEAALARLPPLQRNVLLAHELDGLSCVEIAARQGVSAGAVRARLHRARRRLRTELRAFAPRTKEAGAMVEMELYDVMVRIAAEDTERGALTAPQVIVLRERAGERALPIFVGSAEAGALSLHHGGTAPPRPLTVDLIGHLLEALNARVERVTVSSLLDGTFYALVRVASTDVDARPSDAINLAVRADAPILVDPAVLDQAAVPVTELPSALEQTLASYQPTDKAGEWRSLSPKLVLEAWGPSQPAGK